MDEKSYENGLQTFHSEAGKLCPEEAVIFIRGLDGQKSAKSLVLEYLGARVCELMRQGMRDANIEEVIENVADYLRKELLVEVSAEEVQRVIRTNLDNE